MLVKTCYAPTGIAEIFYVDSSIYQTILNHCADYIWRDAHFFGYRIMGWNIIGHTWYFH